MKINLLIFTFILLTFFMHQCQNFEPTIEECHLDKMRANQSATSIGPKGLRAMVTDFFNDRKSCANGHDPPAMMEKLLHYYSMQQDRATQAIMALSRAEAECRLNTRNSGEEGNFRDFLTQAFNAQIDHCQATKRWMDSEEEQKNMDTILGKYRNIWQQQSQVLLVAYENPTTATTTESTTKSAESMTKPAENMAKSEGERHHFWMIMAIAFFCSTCVSTLGLIVLLVWHCKPKSKDALQPPPMPPKSANEEEVWPQRWNIPVAKSPPARPLVTPLYANDGVSVSCDNAHR